MARIPQNSTELRRLERQLASFRRVLPSLDLKRRQLAVRSSAEEQALNEARADFARSAKQAAESLPMLADDAFEVAGIVRVRAIHVVTESIAGVALPALREIDFDVPAYGCVATPHWFDGYVETLRRLAEARIRVALRERRVARLDASLRKASQRVNLLEHLLIPRAERAARGIQIFLSDAKRAEIVRAKIAKGRHGGPMWAGGASA